MKRPTIRWATLVAAVCIVCIRLVPVVMGRVQRKLAERDAVQAVYGATSAS